MILDSTAKTLDITICKVGDRAFLKLNGADVEIKDYKISSSMHGRTELEVVFEFESEFTEFSSGASSPEHSQQQKGGEDMEEKEVSVVYTRPPESKHCICECGKEWHYDDARYCSACGKELEEVSKKDSL